MTSSSRTLLVGAAMFTVGLALPTLVVWNPAGWSWAERVVGRVLISVSEVESGDSMNRMPDMAESISEPAEREILYWQAPMDRTFVSDQPGKSPMGMDLVPVYADDLEAPQDSGIRVRPDFLQNFTVRTTPVDRGTIPIDLRTIGIVTHNEERLVSVNTKFEGWIEGAEFNTVGEYVEQDDLLFEIYSPQLVTTQREYLAALDYLRELESGAYPDAAARASSLRDAARERLGYWDITDDQIAALERTRTAARSLRIVSPVSGFIVDKASDSLEGLRLTPGMTVFKLVDHTSVWVEVDFFEHQIRHLRVGQTAVIEVDAYPDRVWRGQIVFFSPAMDSETRTLRAFVEVANADLSLRPQMYATVRIETPAVSGVARVPDEAILHSGERSVVIVRRDANVFEPREIEVGATGGGYSQILRGVEPGEIVVTSSQFLIDSESNLRAAINQMLGDRPTSDPRPPATPR
ncbi:MAG: efflux RND transporter periplasmic adaptor subunit [Dehalococcoidia bacterium]|jgi:Cu(I)/Ag(I) efflux system membrane fusion protein/cobalt-zinc-cadmium efflux system membrane fusion protein|nr:efflux RND transporter periplasmic adaptor subunit [Dehalococcoidia bacterium]